MTWKPEVGMEVRCVAPGKSSLTAGRVYIVKAVENYGGGGSYGGEAVEVRNDDGCFYWYFQSCFEPVDDAGLYRTPERVVEVATEFGIRQNGTLDTYATLGAEIGKLVTEKQKSYGDSFSKASDVLAILYPNGVSISQYGDMLTICRILDKLFRIATDKDAFGESPFRDIVGYGLLAVAKGEKK